ncbi:MAG: hypothetical protein DWB56_10220 [Candidatus Jettenia sp.]|uniref:Uncharacterized protein n=1 Tax=Candidatus Jettenia caeni TaxID=247490 RepID=I3IL13_9BACT|nr:hypothetical protein [Candidatus Jettenia sp. AMX1]MBC6929319.1 hypothetical protein [Candidatus Jettenia sp.]NUN22725.1 hypothetical protein [Candidatus Jettenia caeni]MDL1939563.1 hypothetical protein [Candidatus Jettenia sp. AMX1]WKZ14252.1 MAG: hypothetical protein QY317_10075 [Candidatus Jettenia caeni]GAB62408.1 hypothetical protein KSU1_C0812 [Candidatus Jettenia caeni]
MHFKTKGIGIKEYREFVEAGIKKENNSFEEVESGIIPGSEKFKTTTKKSNEKNIEIERYFKINGSTVSKALKRVETEIKRDVNFQKEVESLKENLVIKY